MFHLHEDRLCECKLPCLHGKKCITTQGKLAFHPDCRNLWTPCHHMEKVASQLDEYTQALGNGSAIVPEGCIPLIGYTKKKSTLLEISCGGRNFLEEREIALKTYKKNHKIKWKRQNHVKTASERCKDVKKNVVNQEMKNSLTDVTLSQYFSILEKISARKKTEVSPKVFHLCV